MHGSLPWDSGAEFSKSAVLFLKGWLRLKETSKGWCRTCAQLPRGCVGQVGRDSRQNQMSLGEKALAVLEGCLVRGVAFRTKTQPKCHRRNKGGTGKEEGK